MEMKKSIITVMIFCAIALLTMQPSHAGADQLLSSEELKGWIDNGYIDNWGQKVVILDTGFDITNPPTYDNRATYDAGHIPGAYYVLTSALFQILRSDAIIVLPELVPYGPAMDQFVQNYGIERNTTIVFTGNTIWAPTWFYWTFRYWGFKKSQLFILNGKANGDQSVWSNTGYELDTEEPPLPVPSTFSVSECPGNMDAVRASTEDFFMAAEGAIPGTVVVDARIEEEWNAVMPIPGLNETDVFAFRVMNSIWLEWGEFLVGGKSGAHVFKSKQTIMEMLNNKGITEGMTPYIFSRNGSTSTVNFFVYDALLDRPAKIHDGSSMELGQLGFLLDGGGNEIALPIDSPWRFDLSTYCEIINYNNPAMIIPPLINDAYAPLARLVNEEDKAYYFPLPDIPVAVDIKPGSCPNAMQLNSNGIVTIAILGNNFIDVSEIDPEMIMLTREGIADSVSPIGYSYEDAGTPFEGELCDCHDLNGDGLMDIILEFDWSELIDKLKLNEVAGETVPLTVTGLRNDCTPIRGEDCIRILGEPEIDCECDADWKNHGQYVRCVAWAADDLVDLGSITEDEKDEIVAEAAESDCGKK